MLGVTRSPLNSAGMCSSTECGVEHWLSILGQVTCTQGTLDAGECIMYVCVRIVRYLVLLS